MTEIKSSWTFLFPGQGSQSVGMGYSLISKFPDFEGPFMETLREADSVLGFSLSNLLREGPVEKLKETAITQPALLTVSTALGRYLKTKGLKADLCLGHSLGEYSALVYAESMKFQDAVWLVHKRGQLMSEAVPSGTAGMAALVGAQLDQAQALCKKITEAKQLVLEVSLMNAPGQVVVSGHKEAIQMAQELAKEFGIRRVVPLEVSGPFHSSLLSEAGNKLGKELQKVKLEDPKVPVISNVTAETIKDADSISPLLIAQVSKTVLWEASMRKAFDMGYRKFLEVGSSSVLTGLASKILPDCRAESFENLQEVPH